MNKRLFVLLAGVLTVASVVVGCGSDDDSATASITKAQFIKKAEAACKKGEEQIQTDFAVYTKENKDLEPTEADFAKLVDAVLVPNLEAEIDELRALGSPSGDEEQIEALLDVREESIEAAEADPKAVVRSSNEVFKESSALAKEYGLEACATR